MSAKARELLERLRAGTPDAQREIATAICTALPAARRTTTDDEVHALVGELLPLTLECMAGEGVPGEDSLTLLKEYARRESRAGFPVSAVLRGVQASVTAFGRVVVRGARVDEAAAVTVILARSAALSHRYMSTFLAAYEAGGGSGPPSWWREVPEVAKKSLSLASNGKSTGDIAEALSYSEQAISYHLGNLMRRFGAANRVELVSRAHEAGVLGPEANALQPTDFDAPATGSGTMGSETTGSETMGSETTGSEKDVGGSSSASSGHATT